MLLFIIFKFTWIETFFNWRTGFDKIFEISKLKGLRKLVLKIFLKNSKYKIE